ncbi:MAG: PAS domain-containing protein [Xanthomonadaceae bacterium]|nr:PAS domain-containing protein [Xanthomonadaceae bacterium]
MENSKTVDYFLLQAFLDSLKDPFLFVDTNHIIRYMNKTARNHFKDGANLLNRSLLDCHNEHSRKIIIENLEAFQNGEEERLIHNSEKKRLFMRAVRDGDGQVIGYYERYEPPQAGIRLGEISAAKTEA